MKETVEKMVAGKMLRLETGELAKQASGAVLVTYGDTVVLVTAVAAPLRTGLPFFPLTVEYRENQYAAGKFPGGVIKREGRPTTKEILTMRLIDRPVRPLFPDGYREDVQIIATVLSADDENDPDLLGLIGASAALTISDIPFLRPLGASRVGLVDGQFVVNPTYGQRDTSILDLVVCSSEDAVVMVEGCAKVISEEDLLKAIESGRDASIEVVELIKELAAKAGRSNRAFVPPEQAPPRVAELQEKYFPMLAQAHRTAEILERSAKIEDVIQQAIAESCDEGLEDAPSEAQLRAAFDGMERRATREQIVREGTRYDGRGPDDLRHISCRVGVLPRTHGSAVFTRGETQALVIATLGTVSDEQRILDPLTEDPPKKKFMLHYNFPPFCVGEVRPIRGPGRRDVGHGELSERSLRAVLPAGEEFPYTIRLVSDILESNGSSSMATVCGGTLSLMDAGVPIKDPVAGVSVGLILEDGRPYLLTDIAGAEDHYGDMDFKIAGTQHGVTALQLDIKVEGVSLPLIQEALLCARRARIEILREMLKTLQRPRESISPYAPVLCQVKIDPDKIGKLIGPGGKNIKKVEEMFDCNVEVEDDGSVTVSSSGEGRAAEAAEYIRNFTQEIQVGRIYQGRVVELKEFGAIVELFPGADGLCHISQLDDGYVESVTDVCNVGDEMTVKVISVEDNRVKLSRKAALRESGPEQPGRSS